MRCILDRAGRVALLAAVVIPSLNFVALAQEPTQLKRLEFESESDDILVQDGYVAKQDRIGTKVGTPISEIPQAISVVTQDQIEDQKPRTLNETLGSIGANQNRLENTMSNLKTTILNFTAAESVVRDLDMAEEMMKFSKNNILAQAGTAMLAQANQSGQSILSLLR